MVAVIAISIACGGASPVTVNEYAARVCPVIESDFADDGISNEQALEVIRARRDAVRQDVPRALRDWSNAYADMYGEIISIVEDKDADDGYNPFDILADEQVVEHLARVLIADVALDTETREVLTDGGCEVQSESVFSLETATATITPASTKTATSSGPPPDFPRFTLTCEWWRDHADDDTDARGTITNRNDHDIAVVELQLPTEGEYLSSIASVRVLDLKAGETREWQTNSIGLVGSVEAKGTRVSVNRLQWAGQVGMVSGQTGTSCTEIAAP